MRFGLDPDGVRPPNWQRRGMSESDITIGVPREIAEGKRRVALVPLVGAAAVGA